MLKREQAWRERQKRIAARSPQVRIDRCTIRALDRAEGYEVIIDGFNLHQAISPPRVTVGGVPADSLGFARDGKQLRVRLKRKPAGDRVEVDYGFARAEGRAEWA
jgi:hypothetical protein